MNTKEVSKTLKKSNFIQFSVETVIINLIFLIWKGDISDISENINRHFLFFFYIFFPDLHYRGRGQMKRVSNLLNYRRTDGPMGRQILN